MALGRPKPPGPCEPTRRRSRPPPPRVPATRMCPRRRPTECMPPQRSVGRRASRRCVSHRRIASPPLGVFETASDGRMHARHARAPAPPRPLAPEKWQEMLHKRARARARAPVRRATTRTRAPPRPPARRARPPTETARNLHFWDKQTARASMAIQAVGGRQRVRRVRRLPRRRPPPTPSPAQPSPHRRPPAATAHALAPDSRGGDRPWVCTQRFSGASRVRARGPGRRPSANRVLGPPPEAQTRPERPPASQAGPAETPPQSRAHGAHSRSSTKAGGGGRGAAGQGRGATRSRDRVSSRRAGKASARAGGESQRTCGRAASHWRPSRTMKRCGREKQLKT